jgi:raffinose/stachyose/melibiose transport system permease protein
MNEGAGKEGKTFFAGSLRASARRAPNGGLIPFFPDVHERNKIMQKYNTGLRGRERFLKREKSYLLFILPALIVYFAFSIFPMFSSIYYSLTNWDGYAKNVKFIGLKNYAYMFKDESFGTALLNTFRFVLMDVVLQNVMGLANALLLESDIRGKNVLRGLFFVPVVLPSIVASFIWTYIYGYDGGALNLLLGFFGLAPVDFIGNTSIAIYFVILTGIWQWMSYRMVIYISGLDSIPSELYEAAAIDGASSRQRLFRITLPLLTPAFKINMILCTIGALKQFDIVYTMTKGGPGHATEVIATKIFREAFDSSDYGYGCAIGVILFIIIMVITLLINRFFDKKEVEL